MIDFQKISWMSVTEELGLTHLDSIWMKDTKCQRFHIEDQPVITIVTGLGLKTLEMTEDRMLLLPQQMILICLVHLTGGETQPEITADQIGRWVLVQPVDY